MMNASGTMRVFENLRQEDREISDTIVRLPRVARTIFFCSDYGRSIFANQFTVLILWYSHAQPAYFRILDWLRSDTSVFTL